jgi:hypothetical protein
VNKRVLLAACGVCGVGLAACVVLTVLGFISQLFGVAGIVGFVVPVAVCVYVYPTSSSSKQVAPKSERVVQGSVAVEAPKYAAFPPGCVISFAHGTDVMAAEEFVVLPPKADRLVAEPAPQKRGKQNIGAFEPC